MFHLSVQRKGPSHQTICSKAPVQVPFFEQYKWVTRPDCPSTTQRRPKMAPIYTQPIFPNSQDHHCNDTQQRCWRQRQRRAPLCALHHDFTRRKEIR
jgi:hypothetical protein